MPTEYLNNKKFEKNVVDFQLAKKKKLRNDLMIEHIKETCSRLDNRGVSHKYKAILQELVDKKTGVDSEHSLAQANAATDFHILAKNIVEYTKFKMIDIDDAIQEGVLTCIEKIEKFDHRKGKAFSYFSSICFNSLKQSYRTCKNYNELKRKYQDYMEIKIGEKVIKNGVEIVKFNKN